MKKSTRIIVLTACVLILAGFIFCGIAIARGADIRQMLRDGDFSINTAELNMDLGISVADGQFGGDSGYTVCAKGEESFSAASVERLDIGWIAGSVEISAYDGEEIKVTESASRVLAENEKLRWKLDNGVLRLRYCAPGTCNMQAKALTVLIPESLCLEGLEADVISAELTLNALSVSGEVNFDSVSGGVRARRLVCERLTISTVSGEAEIEGGMESLRYSSTSGGMRADGLPEGCAVETDTVSGNMELRFDGCPGDIEADSTSGSVTVYLPGDVGFELDYDSVSGDLDCDFPSLREVYGGSVMFSMDVSTTSGDLDIRKN